MTRQLELSLSMVRSEVSDYEENRRRRMKISLNKFYFAILAMLVSGALNTIVLKV